MIEFRIVSQQRKSWPAVVSAAILLLASVKKASAYVDPGSGAMLWQLAAASVIGSLFYFRRVTTWIRRHLGVRSERSMGFLFATCYALVVSPLVLTIFHTEPIPRFNDVLLVGVALTAYLFTWESAVYLLVLSVGFSAYVLQVYSVTRQAGPLLDAYRLTSFTLVGVLLICLITRLKAKAAARGNGAAAGPGEPALPK